MKFKITDKTLSRSSIIEADSYEAALKRVFDDCALSWDPDPNLRTATIVQVLRMVTADTFIIQARFEDNDQVYILARLILDAV